MGDDSASDVRTRQHLQPRGKPYILGHMCRPHDCAAEQLEVVFAKDHSAAWGLLSLKDERSLRQNFLGAPDAAMQKVLLKAYQDNNPSD